MEEQISAALMDGQVMVNGQVFCSSDYLAFHQRRIAYTVQKLRQIGAKRIVEIGAHPWMMSAALIDEVSLTAWVKISSFCRMALSCIQRPLPMPSKRPRR